MLEGVLIEEIDRVGFINGSLVRIQCYKYENMFFEPGGELINQIVVAINEKINESFRADNEHRAAKDM